MSAGPIIHAVILNWRTAGMTSRAVRDTLASLPGADDRVWLIDNASGDGSEAHLRAAFAEEPRVTVLQSGRNGGFGFGNNVGLRAALASDPAPDFLFLVNSDAFPDRAAAGRLASFLRAHPRAAAAGSGITGEDGAPHCSSFRFPTILGEFEGGARSGPVTRLLRARQVPILSPAPGQRVDWLAGAALMLRREALEQAGLFDEAFFLYFEETDLCRRFADHGWDMRYDPGAQVVHVGSVSTGMTRWTRVPDYWFDSRWRYFEKHGGRGRAVAATLARCAGGALHRMRCAIARRKPSDPPGFHRHLLAHALRRVLGVGRGTRPALPVTEDIR